MDGWFILLLEEFNVVVGVVDRIVKGVVYLNIEFNSFEKCFKLNKVEYVMWLRVVESFFIFCVDFKEVMLCYFFIIFFVFCLYLEIWRWNIEVKD